MPPIFPQELLDLCIDELHAEFPALKAASLAFRAAAASSQSPEPNFHNLWDTSALAAAAGVLQASLQKTLKTPGLESASLSAIKSTLSPQFHPFHLSSATLKSLLLCYCDGNSDGHLQPRSLAIKTWSAFSGPVARALSSHTVDFLASRPYPYTFPLDEDYIPFVALLPNLRSIFFAFNSFLSSYNNIFDAIDDCAKNADLVKILLYAHARVASDPRWANAVRTGASGTEIYLGVNSPSLEEIHMAVTSASTPMDA
ncbi:hypothetical protein C8J57DRAFT_1607296 [Mycena rebaudengoi]|nr:hypothetical protein C8J57DRAFT_1607296 [Mycena rebaudengoi]